MGQLNFFMTEDEMVDEVNNLLASEKYLIFNKAFFDEETPEPIHEIENVDKIDKLIIWLKNMQCEPKCSLKGTGEMLDKFLFYIYKDPIFELQIGRTIDKLVTASRLYYKTGWIPDNELRKFHTTSTNKVVRNFKKKLTTSQRLKPFYISQDIIRRLNKGYEVELGHGGMRVSNLDLNGT